MYDGRYHLRTSIYSIVRASCEVEAPSRPIMYTTVRASCEVEAHSRPEREPYFCVFTMMDNKTCPLRTHPYRVRE